MRQPEVASSQRPVEYGVVSAGLAPLVKHPADGRDMMERMIAMLIAQGESVEDVSAKVGVEVPTVYSFLESKRGSEMVVVMQGQNYTDPVVRVKKLQNLAIDMQIRLLLNGADVTKVKISDSIIDRSQGKAIQVTENRNLNVNIDDPKAIDRALAASAERLSKLQQIEASMLAGIATSGR